MAGEFDDLMPGSVATTGGGAFDDLMPTPETPDEIRRKKLRQMALAHLRGSGEEPGAGDVFGNAFTLGLQKPTAGLAEAVGGEVRELFGIGNEQPASFGERYKAGAGAYQDFMDEARKNSGWGGTGADVAGSIFSGGPAREVVTQAAASLPRLMGQNALLGGVEGAAENSEDLSSAVKGGAGGAALAAGTTGILGGLIDYAKSLTKASRGERTIQRELARGPDPLDIRQQSRDMYKVLDQGGVAYDLNQSTQLADDIMTELVHGKGGWDPQGAHSVLGGVVSRVEDMRGKPLSLATLQQIRSQAGANATSNEPAVRDAAGRILRSIEGYVQNVVPAQSALPAGQDIGPIWAEARKLWKTANTIEDLNWRVDKAGRRAASTNSGQNEENAIRQNIRQVVDKSTQPGRFNPYTPAEIAQMENVVSGTPAQNAWRSAGNYTSGIAPSAITGGLGGAAAAMGMGGQMDMATALLAPVAATAAGAVPVIAGRAMKNQAANIAQDEADKLVRLIATGSMERLPMMARQGAPTRANLATMMAKQSLLRNTPDAVNSVFGTGNSRIRGQ